jgi:hypothetical protein
MYQTPPGATESFVVARLARGGAAASLVGAGLTVLWVVTMFVLPGFSEGSAAEHLQGLAADDARRSLAFVVVLPLGLVFVPIWIALAAVSWRRHPVAASLTATFGLMYAPLSTLAYWSELTVARGLADAYRQDPAAAVAAYQLFDFGANTSLASAMDLLGYAILGLGTLAAAVVLWSGGRLARWAGVMFALSGALSIAGAVMAVVRSPVAGPLAIGAGLPFLVAVILVAPVLYRAGDTARRD